VSFSNKKDFITDVFSLQYPR